MGVPDEYRLSVSWNGLPQYAARLIKAAIDRWGGPVDVIGSRPTVPIEGMEEVLGQAIHWVDENQPTSWAALGLQVPDIFVQSGWGYKAFNALGREVKARGGAVIGFSDANWRSDMRQGVMGFLAFRFLYRRYFDAMVVPGAQGKRLMRYFGMREDRVREGLYGADPALFSGGPALTARPRTFLYVGQFVPRKDVVGLAKAFIEFSGTREGWTLVMRGDGPQRGEIPQHPNIRVEDFAQPAELADIFRQARFFILPSLVEAWGLVVHEAAASGCALLLSDAIGSGDDLARPDNAIRFAAGSHRDLVRALHEAADKDDAWLDGAEARSRALAERFGPERLADELESLIAQVRPVRAP